MRNFKLVVEYDGTDFFGWQKQKGKRTVQGELERAAAETLGVPVVVHGAGRTDAGVHAWGQVCHFQAQTRLDPTRLGKAISSRLPPDIRIRAAQEVPLDFHARFSATGRSYGYYVRTEPTALWRRYFHVVNFEPDLEAMRQAAGFLIGEKDFASFTPASSTTGTTLCKLRRLEIRRTGVVVAFFIEADHFLHRMVRIMVGTLLEVGRGRYGPERLEQILGKRDRSLAGPTLPPQGLFLIEVHYGRG